MPFICKYTGNKKNLDVIKRNLPSAEVRHDGQFDCIHVNDADYAKYQGIETLAIASDKLKNIHMT